MTVLLLLFCIIAEHCSEGAVDGEYMLRAIQDSFPDKIGGIDITDGDWTITAGGQTFFWAEGRLLPAFQREDFESFDHYDYYHYPAAARPPELYSQQDIAAIRRRTDPQSRLARKSISYAFLSKLYGGLTRTDVEQTLEKIVFLGKKVVINRMIAEPLKNVEAEIRELQGGEAFIASLGSVGCYQWRFMEGTRRMSNHSWGIAVDIQPKKIGGKAIFWLWELYRNKDWMLIPLENRWNPPAPVIEAFERHGFIWGGRWECFDNMHFEYRPELIEFARLQSGAVVSGSGFLMLCRRGRPDEIERALKAGANVAVRDVNGDTPLHWAASNEDPRAAAVLIASGADVSEVNNKGHTALHRAAAFNNNPKVVKILLENGAGIESKDNNGCTPLMHAAIGRKTENFALLLDSGANVNAVDNDGNKVIDLIKF